MFYYFINSKFDKDDNRKPSLPVRTLSSYNIVHPAFSCYGLRKTQHLSEGDFLAFHLFVNEAESVCVGGTHKVSASL